MNPFLLAAAILIFLIGLLHSLLGERLVLMEGSDMHVLELTIPPPVVGLITGFLMWLTSLYSSRVGQSGRICRVYRPFPDRAGGACAVVALWRCL